MNDLILQRITKLPTLPESFTKIESVYHNPKATFKDMADIVQSDPLLTADILKAANSALYGFSHEVRSINKAVSLFGMGTVRGFAMASVVKHSFELDMSAYGISNDEFADMSGLLNAVAVLCYMKKDPSILDLLSPATFLVEMGKVLISHYIIKENLVDRFSEALKTRSSIQEAEREVAGTTTVKVSAALFKYWKFDRDLVDVIENADMPQNAKMQNRQAAEILKCLRTAVTLNATLTTKSVEEATRQMKQYGLDTQCLESVAQDIKV